MYCNDCMSHLMTKPTKWHVRPAKTQISLGIRPIWSESSLSAWRKFGSSCATHWAHSEDSDQTGRMPRQIWVFAGRTCHFVGFVMRWLMRKLMVSTRKTGLSSPPRNIMSDYECIYMYLYFTFEWNVSTRPERWRVFRIVTSLSQRRLLCTGADSVQHDILRHAYICFSELGW